MTNPAEKKSHQFFDHFLDIPEHLRSDHDMYKITVRRRNRTRLPQTALVLSSADSGKSRKLFVQFVVYRREGTQRSENGRAHLVSQKR